jgi:hypothetical protein
MIELDFKTTGLATVGTQTQGDSSRRAYEVRVYDERQL